VTASIALVHACSDGVRAGHIEEHDAAGILTTSVRDLLTGTRPRTEPAMRNSERAISQDAAGRDDND